MSPAAPPSPPAAAAPVTPPPQPQRCTWRHCLKPPARVVVFELPHLLAGSTRRYCQRHATRATQAKGARLATLAEVDALVLTGPAVVVEVRGEPHTIPIPTPGNGTPAATGRPRRRVDRERRNTRRPLRAGQVGTSRTQAQAQRQARTRGVAA